MTEETTPATEQVIESTSPEKEKTNFLSVKEFVEKYKTPQTTVYYMLNNFVKLHNKKTKYGIRKKFSESEMVKALDERGLL